jgi:rhomboid protease GluP
MWGLTSWLAKLGRDSGLVDAVFGGCVVLYVLMLVVDPQNIQMNGLLNLLGPSRESLIRFGAAGGGPVFILGRWWTVLSAGWLHAGLLHIAFNLYSLRNLGPAVAELYGPSRFVILYTVSAITGFLLSSVMGILHLGGSMVTVGASASLLGLLGALVYYGRRSGSRNISRAAWGSALYMVIYAFFPGLHIDNFAHLGGFVGGYLAARVLDPLLPERGNHTAIALACLVLTVASVVASLVVRLPPVG